MKTLFLMVCALLLLCSDVAISSNLSENINTFYDNSMVEFVNGNIADDPEIEFPKQDNNKCQLGSYCNPIKIEEDYFVDQRNVYKTNFRNLVFYLGFENQDFMGPEIVYTFNVDKKTVFTAVLEYKKENADLDFILLNEMSHVEPLLREDKSINTIIEPGTYYLIVDTFLDKKKKENFNGDYKLRLGLLPMNLGNCELKKHTISMLWESNGKLKLPAKGMLVKEAHLSTDEEKWPKSYRGNLAKHNALSESVSSFVVPRTEAWAPIEGGKHYGQGNSIKPPVLDEAWYACMYWRVKPEPGTKMIIFNEKNNKAVVVAAGYESGPGKKSRVAGAVEEVHHYLQTGHLSKVKIGFAVDQNLPLGPIECVE